MKTAALAPALLAALAAANPIDVQLGTLGTIVGPGFQRSLQSALGADSVTFEGVSYPADSFGISAEAIGSGPGSVAMASQAGQWLSKCPDTKLVITGYSQGGMVVHNAAKKLGGKLGVVAAVTFGDPYKGQSVSGVAAGSFKSFCAAGDSVCVAGGCASAGGCGSKSLYGHLGYGSDVSDAAAFVKSVVA